MAQQVTGLPGVKTDRTATPRRVLLDGASGVYLPGGRIIDGSESRDLGNTGDTTVLRAGLVMGMNSTSKMWEPSIIGVLSSAHNSSGTTLTSLSVGATNATEINRRIGSSGTFKLIGPPSAGGVVAATTVTYSAVNTSTGVVTITDIAVNKISGTFICPNNGAEDPQALIPDGTGIWVQDVDNNDIDVPFPKPLVGGIVDSSQIVNWPSDTSLRTWLAGKLNKTDGTVVGGGAFTFDHPTL